MKKHPPAISIKRARELRRDPTEAEKAMWRLLRQCFQEARFRQQVPLRHYIADFASHRLKVVVEVDGGQHSVEADQERTRAIEAEGYKIIRFWNNEVLENADGCFARLTQVLAHPHPHPTRPSEQARKASYPSPIEGEDQ